jgi:hypothetical protein
VNAAGLDARDLTPGLPLRARKGHLIITDRYPRLLLESDRRTGLYQERARQRA